MMIYVGSAFAVASIANMGASIYCAMTDRPWLSGLATVNVLLLGMPVAAEVFG